MFPLLPRGHCVPFHPPPVINRFPGAVLSYLLAFRSCRNSHNPPQRVLLSPFPSSPFVYVHYKQTFLFSSVGALLPSSSPLSGPGCHWAPSMRAVWLARIRLGLWVSPAVTARQVTLRSSLRSCRARPRRAGKLAPRGCIGQAACRLASHLSPKISAGRNGPREEDPRWPFCSSGISARAGPP